MKYPYTLTAFLAVNANALNLDEAVNIALKNNFDIQGKNYDYLESLENVKANKSAFLPKLDASYGYTNTDKPNFGFESDDVVGSVGISYNLFNGFKDEALKESSKFLAESSSYALMATKQDIVLNTKVAYINYLDKQNALETYKFNESASILYKFVWNEFCDWGIEYAKASKDSVVELGAIFKETLKMVSPFMPFISDYLYHKLSGTTLEDGDSLMIMNFPKEIAKNQEIEDMFAIIEEAITAIRRAKVIIDMGNSKIAKAYLKINKNIDNEMAKPFIEKLAKVENIEFVTAKVENSITDVSDNLEVYIPTGEIDMTPIISKLTKQQEKLEKEIAKLSGMLNNERFVANAPANVLEENRTGLANAEDKLAKVVAELKSLS